jgi:MFS family permease
MKPLFESIVFGAKAPPAMVRVNRIEPWYLTYATLGATMGGVVPLMAPLLILKRLGSPMYVGLVMAAFNLGGLAAPVWGTMADRFRIHRSLLMVSLLLTAIALAAFALSTSLSSLLGLALIQGIGASGALTLGSLFIVEVHPQAEWDERIGWYQTFNCSGQAGGMLLAAFLSHFALEEILLIASGMIGMAVIFAVLTPPVRSLHSGSLPILFHPVGHSDWNHCARKRFPNRDGQKALPRIRSNLGSGFESFLAVWFLFLTGASIIYTLYPVMMPEVFGIGPNRLSLMFAAAMGLSVFLYPQAGHCSHRFGAACVLNLFGGLRLCALIAFCLSGLLHTGGQSRFILLAFSAVVLCWPFLSVSGTALTAELSPHNEGEGMGFFNATAALALATGPAVGGWLADRWGYQAACSMAVITEALGFILMCKIRSIHGSCFRSQAELCLKHK